MPYSPFLAALAIHAKIVPMYVYIYICIHIYIYIYIYIETALYTEGSMHMQGAYLRLFSTAHPNYSDLVYSK